MGYTGIYHFIQESGFGIDNLSTYKACFLGAIQAVAKKMGKEEMGKKAIVRATVHLGEPNEMKGFALGVDIQVEGVDREVLDAAHAVCVLFLYFSEQVLMTHKFGCWVVVLSLQPCSDTRGSCERITQGVVA